MVVWHVPGTGRGARVYQDPRALVGALWGSRQDERAMQLQGLWVTLARLGLAGVSHHCRGTKGGRVAQPALALEWRAPPSLLQEDAWQIPGYQRGIYVTDTHPFGLVLVEKSSGFQSQA